MVDSSISYPGNTRGIQYWVNDVRGAELRRAEDKNSLNIIIQTLTLRNLDYHDEDREYQT